MWYILNKTYDAVGVLDNNIPNGCPILRDSWKGQLEDGYTTLEFDVFASHPQAALLSRGCFIIYTDNPDGYELFRITKTTESYGLDVIKTVYCETAATQDLIGQIIEPKSFVGASLSDIVRFLLSNTGWELGVCYYDEIISTTFDDYPTSLEGTRNTIKEFGAEIEFKVEFDGQDVVRKVVNLYEKRGTKTGVTFEYERNLQGVRRIEDGNKIVTAMMGIASNENGNGNPILLMNAKKQPPEGFKVVGNMIVDINALQEYGNNGVNVVEKFIDEKATNPVELFDNTLESLKKVNHPIVSYEADVLMMEQLEGYEHTKVSIGDTIFVKDLSSEPPTYLEARILNKELSTVQKDKGSIVLGEYVPLTIQPIQSVEKARRTLQLKEAMWNATIKKAKDSLDKVSGTQKDSGIHKDAQGPTFTRNSVITYRGFNYGVNVPVYDYGGLRIDTTIGEKLTIPTANVLYAEEGTIEARITPLQLADYNNFMRMEYSTSNRFLLYTSASGRVYFSIDAQGGSSIKTGTGIVQEKKPFDVALRWSNKSKTYSLFVNKKLIGTLKYDKSTYGEFPATMNVVYSYSAAVANLRISKIARTDKELTGA